MRADVPAVGRLVVLFRQPLGIAFLAALTTFVVALGTARTRARTDGAKD